MEDKTKNIVCKQCRYVDECLDNQKNVNYPLVE